MKNSVIVLLLLLFFSSCYTPKYLPKPSYIDVNEYGSYIILDKNDHKQVKGELIAIENNIIVVLRDKDKVCETVPVNEVEKFSLFYASPQKKYEQFIFLYSLITLSHGLFAVITAPLNLIVTGSITKSSNNTYCYSNKNKSFDYIKMFARFPQGIPKNIDLSTIK